MLISQVVVRIEDYDVRLTANPEQRCFNVEASADIDEVPQTWHYVCCGLWRLGAAQIAEEVLYSLFGAGSFMELSESVRKDYLAFAALVHHLLGQWAVPQGLVTHSPEDSNAVSS